MWCFKSFIIIMTINLTHLSTYKMKAMFCHWWIAYEPQFYVICKISRIAINTLQDVSHPNNLLYNFWISYKINFSYLCYSESNIMCVFFCFFLSLIFLSIIFFLTYAWKKWFITRPPLPQVYWQCLLLCEIFSQYTRHL